MSALRDSASWLWYRAPSLEEVDKFILTLTWFWSRPNLHDNQFERVNHFWTELTEKIAPCCLVWYTIYFSRGGNSYLQLLPYAANVFQSYFFDEKVACSRRSANAAIGAKTSQNRGKSGVDNRKDGKRTPVVFLTNSLSVFQIYPITPLFWHGCCQHFNSFYFEWIYGATPS